MIKSKKQMFIIIGVFTLVLMLGMVTYAFFNYTRTGSSNIIKVGRITFNSSQTGAINLTNAFPITSTEAQTDTTNAKQFSITITGDTDYTGGVEYLVSASDVNLSVGYKDLPVALEINVSDNGTESLGTLETGNYYENRENYTTSKYKIEYNGEIANGSHLLVGYIAKNTTSGTIEGINGIINIKAYIDKDKILISDTYDGTESDNMGTTNNKASGKVVFTTDEWNSIQTIPLSFKVKVEANEGLWVRESLSLNEHIVNLASTENYIYSYDDLIASDAYFSNYTTKDTIGDNSNKKTVYFFNGNDAKANSNVLFGGYCWQIVRTTDNGGVKLLYNGVAQKEATVIKETLGQNDITIDDNISDFNYDSNTKKWTSTNHSNNSTAHITLHVKEGGYYSIDYSVSTETSHDLFDIYKESDIVLEDSGINSDTYYLGYLDENDNIIIEYNKDSIDSSGDDEVSFSISLIVSEEESDNIQCQSTRHKTKGVIGDRVETKDMTDATLFGRSYDYNLETGEFTILDSTNLPTSWNTNTANELIGTYTCLSNSNTCSTIYYVGNPDISEPRSAFTGKFTIDDVDSYNIIGRSIYNADYRSLSSIGYMFNKEYNSYFEYKTQEYYANATWDAANSVYVLSNGNSSTTPDVTHHYICDTDCSKVRYYFYGTRYYIILENGSKIEDAMYQMIGFGSTATINRNSDYKLNKYNSTIKGYLDNWYRKNLLSYASYIDHNTVYCNDRSLIELSGWNPNGTTMNDDLVFYQSSSYADLSCSNVSDMFSVSNEKAKLTYPIAILTSPEVVLMGSNYAKIGFDYSTISPNTYGNLYSLINDVSELGEVDYHFVGYNNPTRPVITLKPNTRFDTGTGTYTDPYIIGPIVTRSE